MDLSDEAREAMNRYMRAQQERRSSRHVHTAEGFGLDPSEIRERFASYCDRFDLLG